MKREMELIREVMLRIEAVTELDEIVTISIEERSASDVLYHLQLLKDAKLVEWDQLFLGEREHVRGTELRLTWDGHEFLDNARNEGVWKQVRETLSDSAVKSASFGLVSQLLSKLVARNIGL